MPRPPPIGISGTCASPFPRLMPDLKPAVAADRHSPPPPSDSERRRRLGYPRSPAPGMEGQAPPLDAVAPDPLLAVDELRSPPPAAAEDVLPSATDGQPPPPDAVATEPPTVADEMPLLVAVEEVVVPVAADTVDSASSEAPEDGAGGVVLTDELRSQIVKQVEYYFSDENLPTDEFMLKFVKKNKEGFVPIGVVASFRRMKKLVQDHAIIETALRTSLKLVVSSDGKRVRRLHPLPHTELKDTKKSTVVVENLPPDFSLESIQEKFGAVGKIANIIIHDPRSSKESAAPTKVDYILSSKVATLNDERNWRTGMKVKLLSKRNVTGSGKYNQFSKKNQDSTSKKDKKNQPSKEEQNTTSEKKISADSVESSTDKENVDSVLTPEDELQHQKSSAKGGRQGQYRGQGKGHIQQNAKEQGGSVSQSLNKPIPEPRMPDGTRGFTMGRGRPLLLQKSEKVEE